MSPVVLPANHPAGAGKSAIMHTLAREIHAVGKLGACFFFKRDHNTRGNEKMLVTTIAYQLTLSVPELRTPIFQIVEKEPSVVARSIETQMQKLISEPCRLLGSQDPASNSNALILSSYSLF
ncbi:hypothetical protein B0H14DRAFT_2383906 [Mycena olivaceomarginata]|nr:hypothetical protein B0H14DRAFT_2383906 [Mycena olivaceomarginata]